MEEAIEKANNTESGRRLLWELVKAIFKLAGMLTLGVVMLLAGIFELVISVIILGIILSAFAACPHPLIILLILAALCGSGER